VTATILKGAVLALAAAYLWLGVAGTRAGLAARAGILQAAASSTPAALRLLDRASFGYDAAECTWLAGEVALGIADVAPSDGARERALGEAVDRYLRMMRLTSGSSHALMGLAAVEERLEILERRERTVDFALIASGPWAVLGMHGRTAVGLLLLARRQEPTLVAAHDALLVTLLRFGLQDEAKAAARAAAHAAPALEYHPDLPAEILPRDVLLAFTEGAHEALDNAPLALRERKLFYLGRLDERIGAMERAVDELQRAHAEPAGSIEHAETAYHLGRVLAGLGRPAEAETAWKDAEASDLFRPAIMVERARIAEAAGDRRAALAHLAEARRLAPRRMDLIRWEARLLEVDGNRAAAIETLRWGVSVDSSDRANRLALVEALLADGDRAAARAALFDLESALGAGDDTHGLAERIAQSP